MNEHTQSDLAFRMMSLEFVLRDLLRPPSRILIAAGLRTGMNVVDFGCGPGGFTLAASRIVGPKGRASALDVQRLAVSMVRRRAARKGLENIHPIHGNNVDDLPDESVDMVLLYDILHDIRQPASILLQIHRVLVPAGILSVSDHHLQEKIIQDTITSSGRFRFAGRSRWSLQFEPSRPYRGIQ